jgi:hypothetical protein
MTLQTGRLGVRLGYMLGADVVGLALLSEVPGFVNHWILHTLHKSGGPLYLLGILPVLGMFALLIQMMRVIWRFRKTTRQRLSEHDPPQPGSAGKTP